jgi:hypothetical protein
VKRPISDEPGFEGALHLTQDLPRWRARWGADITLGQTAVNYLFDEIKADRVGTRLALFAELRPTPAGTSGSTPTISPTATSTAAANNTKACAERRR